LSDDEYTASETACSTDGECASGVCALTAGSGYFCAAKKDEPKSLADTCKQLKVDPLAKMSGTDESTTSDGHRALSSPETKIFCDLTAAELSASVARAGGDDYDPSTVCDTNEEFLDYLCNGICADACKVRKADGIQHRFDGIEGKEMKMGDLCGDPCFLTVGSKLSAFEQKKSECKAEGKTLSSGSDDAEGDGDTADDDAGGSGSDESSEEGSFEDLFTLGCATNEKGENCIDKMSMSDEGGDDDDSMDFELCDSAGMKKIISFGCCFGTMLQSVAWGNVTKAESEEITDIASYVGDCPGGEAALRPCMANTLKDVTIVKSEITFTDLDVKGLSKAERRATKSAIATGIATDLGVKPSQVVITKMTTVTTRRRLGTNTKIEYQVTLDPESRTDKDVSTKISNGDVKATTLISAGNVATTPSLSAMSASKVAPSTSVTSDTLIAEPPTGSSSSSAVSATTSGLSTGAIVGIVVGALAAVALIVVGAVAVVNKNKKPKSDNSIDKAVEGNDNTDTKEVSTTGARTVV
jgi:hypothetical protein